MNANKWEVEGQDLCFYILCLNQCSTFICIHEMDFIHSLCKEQHQAVGFNITADKGKSSMLMWRHVLLSQSSMLHATQHNLQHETPLGWQPQLRQADGLSLWDDWRRSRKKNKKTPTYLLLIHCRCGWCLKELWLKENISVLVRTLSPVYVKAYWSLTANVQLQHFCNISPNRFNGHSLIKKSILFIREKT